VDPGPLTDFALNVDRDLDAALDLARKAGELGRMFGVADLEAVGLGQEGLALVCRGSVEGGDAGPVIPRRTEVSRRRPSPSGGSRTAAAGPAGRA
jgi:hypothetical protein